MHAIALQRLTRRYGRRRGIEELSLAVAQGAIHGFLGPNGAGKTTTIRVLLGLLRPDAGRAEIFGRDCWRRSASIKEQLGYVPGDVRLHSWMSGRDALYLFGMARRLDLRPYGRRLAEMFELDLRVPVRKMSRGMRQKLSLIIAMAHEPRLLVLDEPTASLDPLMQETFRSHLRQLAGQGCTVFFSSHTLGEVEQLCDRVAIVREGRLVIDATLESLRQTAGYSVRVRFRSAASAAVVPEVEGLRIDQRSGAEWHGLYVGPIERLMRWLAPLPLADLAIGRPDLEQLFRQFYEATPATNLHANNERAGAEQGRSS